MLTTGRRAGMTRFRCGHCGLRLMMHDRHLRRLVVCHGCGRTTHPVAKRAAADAGAAAGAPSIAATTRHPVHGHTPAERRPRPVAAKPRQHAHPTRRRPRHLGAVPTAATASAGLQVPHVWQGETVCAPCREKLAREALPPAQAALTRGASAFAHAPASAAAAATPRPAGLELSAAPLVPLMLIGATGGAFFVAVSLMSYVGGFVSALALVAAAAVGLRGLAAGPTRSVGGSGRSTSSAAGTAPGGCSRCCSAGFGRSRRGESLGRACWCSCGAGCTPPIACAACCCRRRGRERFASRPGGVKRGRGPGDARRETSHPPRGRLPQRPATHCNSPTAGRLAAGWPPH
jgi:hypothetical protein